MFLAGCTKPEDKFEEIRPVRVQKIVSSPVKEESVYSGEIKARFETPMAFRVAGKIAQRVVDVDTRVKKDQLLATLDPTDYQLSMRSLHAQVAAAEADFDFQKSELARFSNLLKKRYISQTDYNNRLNAYNGAKAKLDEVRALFEQTRNQSDYTKLRALSDGVVTSIDAETGQVVAAGQTVMRIARLEEKEAIINVPENSLNEVRAADDIRVALWAQPSKFYNGRLREISPGADPVTRTYIVKVTILDADDAVQLGMTANVAMGHKIADHVQHLPLTAVVAKENQTFVWIVDPDTNTAKLTPVKLGEYRGNLVSVIAGLTDNQQVVTAGVHKLFPSQKVKILPDETK